MKTFKMRNQNHQGHVAGDAGKYLKFTGLDLIDAIKRNFKEILDASAYYSKPFSYPMTVTIIPPDRNLISDKMLVHIKLEWMWAMRLGDEPSKHTHFFYIEVEDKSDIPSGEETFVILGN
jgi:hypothetical protein